MARIKRRPEAARTELTLLVRGSKALRGLHGRFDQASLVVNLPPPYFSSVVRRTTQLEISADLAKSVRGCPRKPSARRRSIGVRGRARPGREAPPCTATATRPSKPPPAPGFPAWRLRCWRSARRDSYASKRWLRSPEHFPARREAGSVQRSVAIVAQCVMRSRPFSAVHPP